MGHAYQLDVLIENDSLMYKFSHMALVANRKAVVKMSVVIGTPSWSPSQMLELLGDKSSHLESN